MDCSLPGSSVHGIFPGKSTGVGCHCLLQHKLTTQEYFPLLFFSLSPTLLLHSNNYHWESILILLILFHHQNNFCWDLSRDSQTAPFLAKILNRLRNKTKFSFVRMSQIGTSLVVQWLRLCAPNAWGPDLIPGQGTRSHMPQLRFHSHAATKDLTRCSEDLVQQISNTYMNNVSDTSRASLVPQMVKEPPAKRETWVLSLGWEDLLEEGAATHSSILAGRSLWSEKPGSLQSMGSQRAGHDWATKHTDTTDSTDVTTCMFSHFSHVRLFETLWTVALQAPLSMGFPRQEHWSGLPCPPPGDISDPGIERHLLRCSQIFTTSATWESQISLTTPQICSLSLGNHIF